MQNTTVINDDLIYLGVSNKKLTAFENIYPTPNGMAFNSYLLKDEKTVLVQTIDNAVGKQFLENLDYALDGGTIDYVLINHAEPDHCDLLVHIFHNFPNAKFVGTAKAFEMIKQLFHLDLSERSIAVKDGDVLKTGKHELVFYTAPMIHWPEVMMAYDKTDKTLFSADAFGTFDSLDGTIFADEENYETTILPEIRRYYTNIVGKYGSNVLTAFKKLEGLEIKTICSLHGPVWKKNIDWLLNKYTQWATYSPEEEGVAIIYGSIYGNTENAANILARNLTEMGVKNIVLHDLTTIHYSYAVADCFKYKNIVFAAPTYNAEIFPPMDNFLQNLKAHNFQNKVVGIIENGSWAPSSGRKMKELASSFKNTTVFDEVISIRSSVSKENDEQLHNMAKLIVESMNK